MNGVRMYPDTCPFCLPDTQKHAFASSGSFLAIYNKAPILPGHTLIIPVMHVESLRSLPADLIAEFFMFAREITETLLSYFHADAFDWSIQDNLAAGQTVPHLHLHIVVRQPADLPDPGDWYPLLDAQEKTGSAGRPKLTTPDYLEITEQLRAAYHLHLKQDKTKF
jgi:bis(5'-adenosyl)-triphosphatase